MSEENGFLQAIRTNPADISARCAYIDWLDEHNRHVDARLQAVLMEPDKDEHRLACATALDEEAEYLERWVKNTKDRHFLISTDGSPAKQIKQAERHVVNYRQRAEFIRVQCELARLPPCGFCGNRGYREKGIRHQPGARVREVCLHCPRAQSFNRERQLFAQDEVTRSWFGKAIELPVLGTDWNMYLSWFDRGFISCVSTDWFDDWCEYGDQIREETPLRTVTLTTRPEPRYSILHAMPMRLECKLADMVMYVDEIDVMLRRNAGDRLIPESMQREHAIRLLQDRWPGIEFELPFPVATAPSPIGAGSNTEGIT